MKCLVLAFETLKDLPNNWQSFSEIDAYGQSKLTMTEIHRLQNKLRIFNKFFESTNLKKNNKIYDYCFIRHPDPWGEPRNWMHAIIALGDSLNGKLDCEFWFVHEIKAFDFLLKSLLGEKA